MKICSYVKTEHNYSVISEIPDLLHRDLSPTPTGWFTNEITWVLGHLVPNTKCCYSIHTPDWRRRQSTRSWTWHYTMTVTDSPCVEMYSELKRGVITVGIDHQGHEHRDFRGVSFHFTVFSIGFFGNQETSEKVNAWRVWYCKEEQFQNEAICVWYQL